jgi:hypothetical protein
MTSDVFNLREKELRDSIARAELVGLESRVSSYCAAASARLSSLAPDDDVRRDLLSRVTGTLEWARFMTLAERASRVEQLGEASRTASYLSTRMAEASCR